MGGSATADISRKSKVAGKNRCLISTWKTSTLIIHHINHRHIADIRRYCGYLIIALHLLFATIGHAGLILERKIGSRMPQAIYPICSMYGIFTYMTG
jgi:hypothetical protein